MCANHKRTKSLLFISLSKVILLQKIILNLLKVSQLMVTWFKGTFLKFQNVSGFTVFNSVGNLRYHRRSEIDLGLTKDSVVFRSWTQ